MFCNIYIPMCMPGGACAACFSSSPWVLKRAPLLAARFYYFFFFFSNLLFLLSLLLLDFPVLLCCCFILMLKSLGTSFLFYLLIFV